MRYSSRVQGALVVDHCFGVKVMSSVLAEIRFSDGKRVTSSPMLDLLSFSVGTSWLSSMKEGTGSFSLSESELYSSCFSLIRGTMVS